MTCVDREQNLPLRETPERSHGIHWRDVQRGQLESPSMASWTSGPRAKSHSGTTTTCVMEGVLAGFHHREHQLRIPDCTGPHMRHMRPRSEKFQVSACHDRSRRTQVSARRQRLQPKGSVGMGRGPPLSKGRREKRPSSRANKGSRAFILDNKEIPGRAQR